MVMALLLCWAFQADTAYGPLHIADRNPLHNQLLTVHAAPAAVLPRGTWQLDFQLAFSNIFERARNDNYFQAFDMERLTPGFQLRRGLFERWELGLSWGVEYTFGGRFDSLIQNYHDLFGLPNDSREDVPNGNHQFHLTHADGSTIVFDHPPLRAASDDAVVTLKRSLRRQDNGHIAVRGFTKIPLGDDPVSSGAADLGFALDSHHVHGRYHLHLMVAGTWFGRSDHLEALLRDGALTGMAALERRMRGPWSLLAQLDMGTSPFTGTGLSTLEDPIVNFTVGAAGHRGAWLWQVSFAEDLTGNGPAVDFTLDLQIGRRF